MAGIDYAVTFSDPDILSISWNCEIKTGFSIIVKGIAV
jgi:hypothetical protein